MGAKTGIEWTDATWNPIIGCSRVSEGCRNCYAETIAGRFGQGKPTVYSGLTQIVNGRSVWTGQIKETRQLLQPLSWRKPKRVFVNSMSDLFHPGVTRKMLLDIAGVMVLSYWHTFQVLTKRPENAAIWAEVVAEAIEIMRAIQDRGGIADPRVFKALDMRRRDKVPWVAPLPNVWLGVSVENQAAADERIPLLLQTPAAVRFVSAEPLLGPVKLKRYVWLHEGVQSDLPWLMGRLYAPAGLHEAHRNRLGAVSVPVEGKLLGIKPDEMEVRDLDWVICGGESGPHARPMHPDWARSLRDQCAAAGVPFFFKQWGEWRPHPTWVPSEKAPAQIAIGLGGREVPHDVNPDDVCGQRFLRVGKKSAGALLDGVEHKAFPGVRA